MSDEPEQREKKWKRFERLAYEIQKGLAGTANEAEVGAGDAPSQYTGNAVNLQLLRAAKGLRPSTGTIVDATIINAPSSTKNARQERDPEMHQTRKGKQWYFGMKAHVGVDSQTKLIRSVAATAANTADSTMLPHLLHGEETRVWGDQAYRGQGAVLHQHAPQAQDFTHQRYRYKDRIDEVERAKNRTKSRVRSKVEHVFANGRQAIEKVRSNPPSHSWNWTTIIFSSC
jgi:IS5 family transposase